LEINTVFNHNLHRPTLWYVIHIYGRLDLGRHPKHGPPSATKTYFCNSV